MCRFHCSEGDIIGTLWPLPTGHVGVSNYFVKIIDIFIKNESSKDYWAMASSRFYEMQNKKIPSFGDGGSRLEIEIVAQSDDMSKFC